MESLLSCLRVVMPIFLMMAIGYASRLSGLLNDQGVAMINKVVFYCFVPVMVFYNIYCSDLGSSIRPGLILYSVVGVLVTFALSAGATALLCRDRTQWGVWIQGMYRTNFLTMGTAITSALAPEGEAGVFAVLLAFNVPLMNILAVVALELFNGKKADVFKVLRDILRNPLVVGSLVGIFFVLFRIPLPVSILNVTADMTKTTGTLLLFLLGAFFRFSSLPHNRRDIEIVTVFRLFLFPALALGIAYGLGMRGIELVTLIALFATPTAANSFTMAQQMGGDAELAGDFIVVTSALCPLTLLGWSYLFMSMGAV